MKLFKQDWFSNISFFMVVIASLSISACRNPKGEDGVSTLSISIHTDVKNAGDYEACVGGLTKGSDFGCVSQIRKHGLSPSRKPALFAQYRNF